ncbi:hypothetical protein [Corynebacterium caspium]|uniref:hypothetical protein n=1 Tax=Corynebacterium caspium TaxID=234828 RepID=UPI00037756B4|nr:hypothetical protein [Corynebacterium caspium]WKD59595.1 hypothetical protein CCASP_06050 [Corynebacterium caspium DSM 44850]
MLHAVSFALLDSINVLLIGIIVALGVMLPRKQYFGVAAAVIIGDWFGVFSLASMVLYLFSGLGQWVEKALASPYYAWALIAVGVLSIFGTWRTRGGEAALIGRFLGPLKKLTWKTIGLGFLLGLVQSATSAPFYAGLLHLSAVGLASGMQLAALVLYASLALSLPAICAVAVALASQTAVFNKARHNADLLVKVAGYAVGAILVFMGITA